MNYHCLCCHADFKVIQNDDEPVEKCLRCEHEQVIEDENENLHIQRNNDDG